MNVILPDQKLQSAPTLSNPSGGIGLNSLTFRCPSTDLTAVDHCQETRACSMRQHVYDGIPLLFAHRNKHALRIPDIRFPPRRML